MAKYLDINGLAEVWAKMKSYVSSGYVSKTGDSVIDGNLKIKRICVTGTTAGLEHSTTGTTAGPVILYVGGKWCYGTAGYSSATEDRELATKKDIADLVNSAPETLDTLGELATVLQENENVVNTLNAAIGNKAEKNHNHTMLYDSGGTNMMGDDGSIIRIGSTMRTILLNQLKTIYAPTSSNGTTYGAGSAGQVLTSNGTSVYWASPTVETLTTAEIEAICV